MAVVICAEANKFVVKTLEAILRATIVSESILAPVTELATKIAVVIIPLANTDSVKVLVATFAVVILASTMIAVVILPLANRFVVRH